MYNQLTPRVFECGWRRSTMSVPTTGPSSAGSGSLEDVDDVASRNAMRRATTGERVLTSQLSRTDAARVALFEHMISNLDWSMRAGPAGERCCHNSRLIAGSGSTGNFVPVPYDFDFSGLVNAPYAVSPDGRSGVRARQYRGYCVHNARRWPWRVFRLQRAPLLAVLNEVRWTSRPAAGGDLLDGFFSDIADDRKPPPSSSKTVWDSPEATPREWPTEWSSEGQRALARWAMARIRIDFEVGHERFTPGVHQIR